MQQVGEAPEGDSVPFALWWILGGREAEPVPWKLTRLTNDVGLSASPALLPDGKLLAYSSDRGVEGELDLYVKQVAGGQPIRLTTDGAQNTMPDFSPDGSRIVFRSNRGGGGIYEIPAFGGEARLVKNSAPPPASVAPGHDGNALLHFLRIVECRFNRCSLTRLKLDGRWCPRLLRIQPER